MHTNGNDCAFPLPVAKDGDGLESSTDWRHNAGGLTKREQFAAMAMQGMLSDMTHRMNMDNDKIAEHAVYYADALIQKLNSIEPGEGVL